MVHAVNVQYSIRATKTNKAYNTPAKISKLLSIRIVHQELTILHLQDQTMAAW